MSDKSNIGEFVTRFKWIFVLTIIVMIVVVCRIVYIQFFSDDIYTESEAYETEILYPNRGSILSHDGRPLAETIPYYQVHMDFDAVIDTLFRDESRSLADSLANLFRDRSASKYYEFLKEKKNTPSKNKYVKIGSRDLDYNEMQRLKKFPIYKHGMREGGLIIDVKNRRNYPYGTLAKRTIGSINSLGVGAGIEKSFDYKLQGKNGERLTKKIPGKRSIPVNSVPAIPAEDGYDIQTTIDINIQEAAENALREQLTKEGAGFEGGTVLVMEVKTGAIRAITNLKRNDKGGFEESFNYAIGQATEPGSTLKLVSLICMLEDGCITLGTPIDGGNGLWKYEGVTFSDTHHGGYGQLDVKGAFEKSSNVCFSKLTVDSYLGKEDEFISRIHSMKLNERFNLELEGEAYTDVPSPDDKNRWSKVTLPMIGIGYGVLLTPLHTLTFYNAIANDGTMMKPYFIENFQQDGKIIETFKPQVLSGSICSKSTIREAKKALRGVVENGTAKNCLDPRYSISGKTGTAQIANGKSGYVDAQGYKRHQASFAGFFPSEDPKYSCIVVLYSDKTKGNFYGGSWASPVFKKVADKIFTTSPDWKEPLLATGMRPSDNPSVAAGRSDEGNITLKGLPVRDEIKMSSNSWVKITKDENGTLAANNLSIVDGIVPDVKDMGLKDALFILENEGFRVSFKGKGRVTSQKPEAGTALNENGLIELLLTD